MMGDEKELDKSTLQNSVRGIERDTTKAELRLRDSCNRRETMKLARWKRSSKEEKLHSKTERGFGMGFVGTEVRVERKKRRDLVGSSC